MRSSSWKRLMFAGLTWMIAAGLTAGCGPRTGDARAVEPAAEANAMNDTIHNTLTEAERADGWRLLFDGRTTNGWRGFRQESMPQGWEVVDGTLAFRGSGGDIVTDDVFEDFDLLIDWRVGPGGNSGIFYRVSEDVETIYHSAPEYQLLDDAAHADGASPTTSAGSAYGLYPTPRGAVKPAGEWNSSRIIVRDNHVEHWLNGVQTASYELWSDDWEARVRDSKFSQWPPYGRATRGNIGLQDHGDPVSFRNIKIREL